MEALLGATLLVNGEEKPTGDVLAGATAIGLYFSAHWCPPCRGFTPKMADMYKNAFEAKGMRVVFVSSDRDEASFKEYFGEMPWAALPYANREAKDALSKKFKVSGIPHLTIVKPDGTVITNDGRSAVSEDPTGKNYPWTPMTKEEKAAKVLEVIGSGLVSETKGKPFGVYFSAHWCPPCRGFTPKLAQYYNEGLKDKMEIIFCSSDRDQESFDSYRKEQPWLAMPFEDREGKDTLSKLCDVQGIPSFQIFSADGTLITSEGRAAVENDPKGNEFPEGWLPQPFNDVNIDPSALNEEKCLLAMGKNEKTAADVKAVAMTYFTAAGKDVEAMPLRFFKAGAGGVEAQLRKLTKLEGDQLIMLDIPDNGSFYVAPAGAGAQDFVNNVLAGQVEKKTLEK